MYGDFARIYDKLQPDSEYEKFADYIEEMFAKFGKPPRLVLDLACGTGRLTALLAKRGYDMIGVDISAEALNLAATRAEKEKQDILFLQQDMTDFELYGTVDAIICCFDSVNYITCLRELKKCFSLCKNYLNPGGILIFDINTPYKFKEILANNTFVYESADFEDIFCVCENNYFKGKNEFRVTFFEKTGENYAKFEEIHVQRRYEIDEIKNIFEGLKMPLKACCHEFSTLPQKKKSERIFFVYENKC